MRTQQRTRAAALLGMMSLLIAVLWWSRPEPAPAVSPASVVSAATAAAAPPGKAQPDVTTDAAGAGSSELRDADLALLQRWQRSSLRGTEVDGGVRLDAMGRVLLDLDLRRLFDHFLSLTGEFSDGEIRRLLGLQVEASHGAVVAAAVLEAFDRYLGLRNALASIPATGDLQQRFAALQRARREWFGDAADAMFGDDEAHTAYTLERLALLRDSEIDAATRQRRLDELDASRPRSAMHDERSAVSALLAEEQTRQLDALGASDPDRHAERSALWGDDAADRLAALDRERSQWDQRIADYIHQRDRIAADVRLDAAARAAAIDALRRRSFADNERVRIESLESINALSPGG